MHRRFRFPLIVMIALVTLGAMPEVKAVPVGIVAAGPAHQVLTEENDLVWKDCEGDGVATFVWTPPRNRFMVSIQTAQCVPTNSLIQDCGGFRPDGTFRCERVSATEHLNVTLAPDGSFEFFWQTPTFMEHDMGVLVRQEANWPPQ